MGLLSVVLAVATLQAQTIKGPVSDPHPDSMEGLLRELRGTDRSRRRFAIREFNHIARVARKREFGPLERDSTMSALQQLAYLDDYVAEACIAHLRNDIEVRGCARLLGHLETTHAYRAVSEARSRADSRGTSRVLDRTLRILEQASKEAPQ